MGRIIDLTGKEFGHLKVIEFYGLTEKAKQSLWKCRCSCGNIKIARATDLKKGDTTTCGDTKNCKYAFNVRSNAHTEHDLRDTREYQIWIGIKQRCYDENLATFDNYGGRGIIMHDSWVHDFQVFYEYLQTLPETREQFETRTNQKATIDRIDVNGNYEPGNLQWVSNQVNCQNRRSTVLNEQMVKFILWHIKVNNYTVSKIMDELKKFFGYHGYRAPIYHVIKGNSWTNINIDKEINEYLQFKTINGNKIG